LNYQGGALKYLALMVGTFIVCRMAMIIIDQLVNKKKNIKIFKMVLSLIVIIISAFSFFMIISTPTINKETSEPIDKNISTDNNQLLAQKIEYIKKYIVFTKLEYHKNIYGKIEVTGTIKNLGDKRIIVADLCVYFLDQNEHALYEENHHLDLGLYSLDPKPIRPNYEANFLITVNPSDIPSSWAKKIKAIVYNIEYYKYQ